MYFVDNSSAVKVMPTPGVVFSTDPLWFTQGDANNRPTYPGPDWFNITQAELLNLLAAANLTPKKDDNTQLSQAIAALISAAIGGIQTVPDIDELYITKGATDPNVKWPGTTWVYLGEGLTLRTAKADGSDLGATTGADTVIISAENMPSHTHSIGGSTGNSTDVAADTSSFDYGTKQTDTQGDHGHVLAKLVDNDDPALNGYVTSTTLKGTAGTINDAIQNSGSHLHNVGIGAHSHSVTLPAHSHALPAATGATGSGSALSVLQKSIMIAVWVRTA
jgi:microcystin-dependent protein